MQKLGNKNQLLAPFGSHTLLFFDAESIITNYVLDKHGLLLLCLPHVMENCIMCSIAQATLVVIFYLLQFQLHLK
jgi:hypothetical protein